MITIQKTRFDFRMENQSFAQTLYGQWDHFCRTSFESVAERVLSRYDRADELIRIESLELDLGELDEEDFYDDFPRVLARKLDEKITAYLAHTEAYPEEITVIPIRRSLLERFAFYLLHGYLAWEEEPGKWDFPAVLAELIRTDPDGLLRFLQENGMNGAVRERLVFQLPDRELERLAALAAPSDSHFIVAYVAFLIRSHRQLERPEITQHDYRNVVWLVVWTYLLAESKGYYSRKQLVQYTLQQLAARYNVRFLTLLDMLSAGLKQFVSGLPAVPELLVLLAQIREERMIREKGEQAADALSLEELKALLSAEPACRTFLRELAEPVIYGLVERVIPSEAPFVIRYARSLDREKEKGMLEGKAGEEFRLLKWVFMFSVLLRAPQGHFSRLQFAYSVLEKLAAHYNLDAYELLVYFYRSLMEGEVQADHQVRDLIIALFWQKNELFPPGLPVYFPQDLRKTLADIHLCRRFLAPLPEEKIYGVAQQAVPSEAPFIIRYAKVLDKGKERNALEGKAGAEFRLLKWEFIFLVVFGAPLAYFNRKQFVRSVLQQIAAHYNLETGRLLAFFYENRQRDEMAFPSDVQQILAELYEDVYRASPDSLFVRRANREYYPAELQRLLLTGESELPAEVLKGFAISWERTSPEALLDLLAPLESRPEPVRQVKLPGAGRVLACVLRTMIRRYGLCFPGGQALLKRLDDIEAERCSAPAGTLMLLIYYCIQRRADAFQRILDQWLGEKASEKASETAGSQQETVAGRTAVPEERTVLSTPPVSSGKEIFSATRLFPETVSDGKEGDTSEIVRQGKTDVSPAGTFPWENKAWAYRRLQQMASPACRTVLEELLFLMASLDWDIDEAAWLEVLSFLAKKEFAYYSREALLRMGGEKLAEMIPASRWTEVVRTIRKQAGYMPGLAAWAERFESEMKGKEKEKATNVTVYVRNAGLVLLSPFFPRLFGLLKLLDEKKRLATRENRIKAIFALQYLATGEEAVPEYELFLNKLLTGYRPGDSFPCFWPFEEEEKQILLSLLGSVGQLWDKLKNTSVDSFRNSFLLRDGVIEEQADKWVLTVEARAYDVLLDMLPWGYSPVKFLWMEKPVYVKWR